VFERLGLHGSQVKVRTVVTNTNLLLQA